MQAIATVDGRLTLTEQPTPEPGPGEVRIRVHATAVNRADLIQRAGHYDPPPGASAVLGLECAGVIDAVGRGVSHWVVGERVCALLSGGGYATHVVVPAGQLLPMGDLDFPTAAALPEAVCTVHDALFVQAGLQPGERVLLHAGASGIGTTAIQLCVLHGCEVFTVVGSDAKVAATVALGAAAGHNRHTAPWTEAPWATDLDVILDPVGKGTVADGLGALRSRGRLVVLGLLGGRRETIDLGRVLVKRLTLLGTVLRSRSTTEKAAVVDRVRLGPWADVLGGRVRPSIHSVLPLQQAEDAHQLVASNQTTGKVVLTIAD